MIREQRFEHTFVSLEKLIPSLHIAEQLSKYEKQGWELVSTMSLGGVAGGEIYLFFKRPYVADPMVASQHDMAPPPRRSRPSSRRRPPAKKKPKKARRRR